MIVTCKNTNCEVYVYVINLNFWSYRNWDCDACKTNVEAMQEIFLAPTTAVRVTEYLKGEAFCQDPSLAFTEEETKGIYWFYAKRWKWKCQYS